MLAIRLRRTGSKKRPFFRVVVTDSRAARDSSFVEVLGHYNPRTKPETLEVDRERLDALAEVGAQPSDTVRTLVDADAAGAGRAAPRGAARVVSRARDVVEVVARALADQPDAVRVTEREHRGQTLVELFMAPGDLGRVIGRQGRTARGDAHAGGGDGGARGHQGDARVPRPAVAASGRRSTRTDDMATDDLLLVGRVARAHGIRGQVIVNPETDFRGAVRVGAGAAASAPADAGAAADRDGAVSPGTADRRARGRRDDERRRGAGRRGAVGAGGGARRRCPQGTFYRHDLVGCEVARPTGQRDRARDARWKGRWSAAAWSSRAARRSADPAGRRRSASSVDPARRRIVVDPPEGLLELNERVRAERDGAVKIDIVTIFPAMVRGAARGRDRRAGHRARAARRRGARPARLHDRPAPGRRRHAVWRRAGDGAEAGAAVSRRSRRFARRAATPAAIVLTSPDGGGSRTRTRRG